MSWGVCVKIAVLQKLGDQQTAEVGAFLWPLYRFLMVRNTL